MTCLKCGRQTGGEQAFCDQCLEVMDVYPVKQDVHIQLPARRSVEEEKKAARKRRTISADEQVSILRSRQRRLAVTILVLVLLLCVTAFSLVQALLSPETVEWGKNYTFIEPFH